MNSRGVAKNVRYDRETYIISSISRYKRDFVIKVTVVIEFDCNSFIEDCLEKMLFQQFLATL